MLELRTLTDDDMPALRALDEWAFGQTFPDDRFALSAARLERPRQRGAFVGGELAGHVAAFSQTLTVPGGMLPAAGVTWVGVPPQHRRRGVASRLLRDQLTTLAEHGEAVATLWAAENGIYGRFGYGVASRRAAVDAPRGLALIGADAAGHRVVLGNAADLRPQTTEAFDRLRPRIPGMVSRAPADWDADLFDDPEARREASPRRGAVVLDGHDQPAGYAWFRTRVRWADGHPSGTVDVDEVLTDTPGAARALLDVLLDIDLTTSVTFWNLPIDHPLLTWAQHTVGLVARVMEQLWVRLVRVEESLSARTYAADVDMVLDVTDELLPRNAGRWRLHAGPDGCEISPSTAPAHVSLDVRDLGAAYLGDDTLARAMTAGTITENVAGSVDALARAFRGSRAPYCGYMF